MMRSFSALLIMILFMGCASPPSKISPMPLSRSIYADLSCEELEIERRDVDAMLQQLNSRQRQKVGGDAASVFFVFIPISLFSGDYEARVSRNKGELLAIDRAMLSRDCKQARSHLQALSAFG
jgi:hypothetical protein